MIWASAESSRRRVGVLVLKFVISGFAALVVAVGIVTVTESTPGSPSVALADTPTPTPTPTDTLSPTPTDTPSPTPTDTPSPTPSNCDLTAAISGIAAETDLASGKTANLSATATINGGSANCDISWTVTVAGDGTPTTPTGGVNCAVTQPAPNSGSATVPPSAGGSYAFTATIPAGDIHECGYDVTLTATATGLHQTGSATTTFHGVVESNVLVAKYCLVVGPAAVNLSDTNGRNMFTICEIGNVTSDAETVTIADPVTGTLPAGCTTSGNTLILPGATQFTMLANEQWIVVYRDRYECHTPATPQVATQTVTFTVTHVPDTGNPAGDVETFTSDNTKTVTRQVIIQ